MQNLGQAPLRISEIFESFQGEGASAGAPAVFLRLASCNLRCRWCDTPYSWDWARFDYAREVQTVSVEETARRLNATTARTLVVTGGEPLLQQSGVERMLGALGPSWRVEVETNGTVAPSASLLARIDQWNVSPKLSNSGDPLARRIRRTSLYALQLSDRAWLKLVVRDAADLREAQQLVQDLHWPADRVMLMPEVCRKEEYEHRLAVVSTLASAAGFSVSPRLHVLRFDGARGR